MKIPKQAFIDDRIGSGCPPEDILWLADLEFDEKGDIRPRSIYESYLGKQ